MTRRRNTKCGSRKTDANHVGWLRPCTLARRRTFKLQPATCSVEMISLSANEVGGEGRGEVAFGPAAPHPDPLPALRCGAREEFPGVVKDFYKAPATCNLRGSWLPDMDLN